MYDIVPSNRPSVMHRVPSNPASSERAAAGLSGASHAACLAIAMVLSACVDAPRADADAPPSGDAVQEVLTYRACSFGNPGELVPLPRSVPAGRDPVAAAIAELVTGVNADEAAKGCTSYFSERTQDVLRAVRRSGSGDTVTVEFRNLKGLVPEVQGARSFLPPGIMAELTWTVFRQYTEVEAIRFSIDGDEQAFWHWLGGPGTPAQVYTRADWEQI